MAKVLHCGIIFGGCENFQLGVLLTKRQVMEIFYFRNFHTADAANDVANEIYYRWVWCNVYPLHHFTISKPNFASSSACPSEMETVSAADNVFESESTCTSSSQSSATSELAAGSSNIPVLSQNRKRWSNLARMCERYQLSDRAAAAIANSVLIDVGIITEDDKTCVIDRSKVRREKEISRQEIQKEEQQNFRFVNAIYFDGRKDTTQIVVQGPNDKHYRSIQLEEHYTAVGEPGSYYLTYVSPKDGKGRTIAQNLFDSIHGTELEDRLAIVDTDGTAYMTGKYNGCIRHLEELVPRPLQ